MTQPVSQVVQLQAVLVELVVWPKTRSHELVGKGSSQSLALLGFKRPLTEDSKKRQSIWGVFLNSPS